MSNILTLTLSVCLAISIYTTPTTLATQPIPTYQFQAHSRHMLKTFTSGEKSKFSQALHQSRILLTQPNQTFSYLGKTNQPIHDKCRCKRAPHNPSHEACECTKPNQTTSHHITNQPNLCNRITNNKQNKTTTQHNTTQMVQEN